MFPADSTAGQPCRIESPLNAITQLFSDRECSDETDTLRIHFGFSSAFDASRPIAIRLFTTGLQVSHRSGRREFRTSGRRELRTSGRPAAPATADDPAVGSDDITQRATEWLAARRETGLILVEKSMDSAFTGSRIAGSESVMFNYAADGYRITLGFGTEITPDSTIAQLREQIEYVALDALPTPGLREEGWEISPRTPISSFSEGVELLDYRDGRITLRIKTGFFALSGSDSRVIVPADAGMPEDAYFQIREEFPLDLTIDAPISTEYAGG